MGYYNTADRFVGTKWTSSLNEKKKKTEDILNSRCLKTLY